MAITVVICFLLLIFGAAAYIVVLGIRNAHRNHKVITKRKKFKVIK